MVARLTTSQQTELEDAIVDKLQGKSSLTDQEIAIRIMPRTPRAPRSIRRARRNLLHHGSISSGRKNGRPKEITENMWLALKHELESEPSMSQEAMALFLQESFEVHISRFMIGRELKLRKWSKKVTQTIAKEQRPDLRDDYIERRSHFRPDQMVYIDESGCDRGIATLGRGYAPVGVTPLQRKRFHRGKRVQMLPAYTIEGVIYAEVYEENTDTQVFEGFIERLLPFCGRYPGPKSVIFMDNASFHFSPKIDQMLAEAGVRKELQPPYCPDLNPIEYFFGSVKNHIRSRAREDRDLIQGDFKSYLLMTLHVVGGDERIANGHFKKAQIASH